MDLSFSLGGWKLLLDISISALKCKIQEVKCCVKQGPVEVNVACAEAPHWMEVKHGRLKLGQFDGGNAEGPDVTQMVVPALLLHRYYLRSHPANSKVAGMSGVEIGA